MGHALHGATAWGDFVALNDHSYGDYPYSWYRGGLHFASAGDALHPVCGKMDS